MKAPIPGNEAARLQALRLYEILDTEAEQSFDDLTRLASDICGTPIALVSLMDEGRQWMKSRVGTEATEVSRDVAFCAHAILQADLFVVPDAMADKRFADNPLVAFDPKIRFYAGAPLINPEGFPLGTLCVLDRVPRSVSGVQVEALRTLSRAVVTQLELRRKVIEVARGIVKRERAEEELRAARRELRLLRKEVAETSLSPAFAGGAPPAG